MYFLIKLIFLLLLLSSFSFSKELEKVKLQFQWLDQFQFAGYYIAKEKGFYNDVGLDVEFLKFKNTTNVVYKVMSGEAHYGTGRTSLIINKTNQNLDVIALAAIFQHAPSALLVTNLDEIKTVKDLKNRKIMITENQVTSASYLSMLFSQGIRQNEIIKQKQSFNIEDLINKKTDAISAYISNEPFRLEQRGIKYKYFHPKDFGFDFYGDILFTSKEELNNNPIRVKNFREASLMGWEYAFSNIEETAKFIFNNYNIQKKSLEALIFEGYTLKDLAYKKGVKLGDISVEKFKEISNIYKLLGLFQNDYNLTDFIYKTDSNKELFLNKEELVWLKENSSIKVATNKEWNPIEFMDENENIKGIASGYLKLINKKLNLEFTIKNKKFWHEMIDDIKDNKADMFTAMVRTPQREKFLNFTQPYLTFPTVILTQDDVGYIKDMSSLDGKIIVVERSFYTDDLLTLNYPKIKLLKVNTTKDAIEKVYQKEAFAYIGALPNIGYLSKN